MVLVKGVSLGNLEIDKAGVLTNYRGELLVIGGGLGDILQSLPFILLNRHLPVRYHLQTHLRGAGDLFRTLGIEIERLGYYEHEKPPQVPIIGNIYLCPRTAYFAKPLFPCPPDPFADQRKIIGIHLGASKPDRALPAQVLQEALCDDFNFLLFGSEREIAALGIAEGKNLKFVCFSEIAKCLGYVNLCDGFIGSDSGWKTASSMSRIHTVVWMPHYVDNLRDSLFVNPYKNDGFMLVYYFVPPLDDERMGVGVNFTMSNLRNAIDGWRYPQALERVG